MSRKCSLLLLLGGLSVGLTSCEKLPSTGEGQHFEPVQFREAIPLEYGNLVAVTSHPAYENWFGLSFEKSDKTITLVWVDIAEGRIGRIASIPRK